MNKVKNLMNDIKSSGNSEFDDIDVQIANFPY